MANSETIIVGGGLGTSGTLRVGGILVVQDDDPATAAIASSSLAFDRTTHVILSDGVTLTGTYSEGVLIGGNGAELTSTGASSALGNVILGNGAILRGGAGQVINTVIVGHDATAIGSGCSGLVLLGGQAAYTGVGSAVQIGASSSCATQLGVCIGHASTMGTTNSSSNSVLVGCQANLQGQRNVAIGDGVSITGGNSDSVCVGQSADIAALRCIAIGSGAQGVNNDCIVFGVSATSFATNQFIVGGSSQDITTVVVGKGNTSGTPSAVTYRQTNGTGSNIAGGSYTVQPGLSTGNATPGKFIVSIGKIGSSGSTLQTAYAALTIDNTSGVAGNNFDCAGADTLRLELRRAAAQKAIIGLPGAADALIVGVAADALCLMVNNNEIAFSSDNGVTQHVGITAPAAGETALWLYDADNATLERVTVGAANSGGAGFKLLRIPN